MFRGPWGYRRGYYGRWARPWGRGWGGWGRPWGWGRPFYRPGCCGCGMLTLLTPLLLVGVFFGLLLAHVL
jgi:hypothetical protein